MSLSVWASFLALTVLVTLPVASLAQNSQLPLFDRSGELPDALDGNQIAALVKSVDRGLSSLQQMQIRDGSFQTSSYAKTGITSLAIMAYLSRGHKPGDGPYGSSLNKAINYVLSQQQESGIFSHADIDLAKINVVMNPFSHTLSSKSYNHAIAMLMLGEVFGMIDNERESFRIRQAIDKGLKFTIQLWDIRKSATSNDEGGFRYTRPWKDNLEGDVSVTGWHAASLRSIRNAGFDVPQSVMNRISDYVRRTQRTDGGFGYSIGRKSTYPMSGAGALCLALAGKYDDPSLDRAARYLAKFDAKSFRSFSDTASRSWPYYTCYYITQSTIQMGGQVWVHCMGQCADFLIKKQDDNGLWPPTGSAAGYGKAYSTSMAIIALTPPLQLLPIYQR